MRITEIFHSIQGESTYSGLPCVFVRTTGCNLRCVWCDTAYAFHGGREMSLEEILARVRSYDCKLVELTGGEPMLQKETPELARRLLDEGFTVLIETGGSLDLSPLDPRVIKIMDLKCPGSGEMDRNYWPNLDILQPHDQIKFVINDRRDYDWALRVIGEHRLAERFLLLFSPVFGGMDYRQLAEWMLADRVTARFQIQLHKYIWPPDMRGV
ncbi:MAG: radical SAM protein [candidate division KSB1 bacterium]|nr:radical SAM protein [candidate division KSB1 bacterium]MDZ7273127.1 radical SAM protein [candidate division KSB1 bacterium]MDZ7285229.1 radical SAM protein [candidate division KSB1 bacterium]MDZ7298261.1 radical SAM protein [candidate division KSB1 bacterium]MDZ7308264.1 radical SAM protein [candidate division KSB1 bacterium]